MPVDHCFCSWIKIHSGYPNGAFCPPPKTGTCFPFCHRLGSNQLMLGGDMLCFFSASYHSSLMCEWKVSEVLWMEADTISTALFLSTHHSLCSTHLFCRGSALNSPAAVDFQAAQASPSTTTNQITRQPGQSESIHNEHGCLVSLCSWIWFCTGSLLRWCLDG